ncbi:MAG: tyrosine recombinase XerC [Sulfuriferula sp.]|nr:tyrosine recombinase XerC [Sulfuriferula sp.]
MNDSSLVDAYLTHLAAERGLSAHTVSNYARDVRLLLARIDGTTFAELRAHDIRRIIATLHAQGLSGKSLARTLSAWRGLFHYLGKRHDYTHNPCEGLRAPKYARTLPRSLSVEQVTHLLDAPDDTPLAVRDNAIFELFYSSGLRLSELATLKLGQMDLTHGEISVTGKGNKSRLVPLGKQASIAMQRWLAQRSDTGDYVFPGRNGGHLTQRAIELRLKHRADRIGLDAKVHPHVLRHAFASHLLQSSGDLRAVQELLGHASISTTQIYTQLDFQHLAATYDLAHPRAKKKP